MKLNLMGLLGFIATACLPFTVGAVDLIVVADDTLTTPATYDNVIVRGTGTHFTVDASLTVLNDMTIETGATVTHSLRNLNGLVLTVQGTLEIRSGGKIDIVGRGLLGGDVHRSLDGEAYDSNDAIVSAGNGGLSSSSAGGGSYGGRGSRAYSGSQSNPCYGLVEDPHHLGAGGGGTRRARGGNGGGKATIHAQTLVVNGVIDASGSQADYIDTDRGGGGAGGAINITAGTVSGGGTIRANGARPAAFIYLAYPGAGGGGRIAVFYESMTFPVSNFVATGARTYSSRNGSGAGTIYLKKASDSYGALLMKNDADSGHLFETPLRTTLSGFRTVDVGTAVGAVVDSMSGLVLTIQDSIRVDGDRARLLLRVGTHVSVSGSVHIGTTDSMEVATGATFTAGFVQVNSGVFVSKVDFALPFDLQDGGTLVIAEGARLPLHSMELRVSNGTIQLAAGSRLDVVNDRMIIGPGTTLVKDGRFGANDTVRFLKVKPGGRIRHSSHYLPGLSLQTLDSLVVDVGGQIDVSKMGLYGGFGVAGETFSAADSIVPGAGRPGAGASYGGSGAAGRTGSSTNMPYGLLEGPRHLGSGGGAGCNACFGGNGGGRVSIHSGVLVLNGVISADGGPGGGNSDGAGSGGAVLIDVVSMTGGGSITCRGGDATARLDGGGGGGGGRTAIRYDSLEFDPNRVTAAAGNAGNAGSPGTVFLQRHGDESGNVIIDGRPVISGVATHLRTELARFTQFRVRGSTLSIDQDVAVTDSLIVDGNSILVGPPLLQTLGSQRSR